MEEPDDLTLLERIAQRRDRAAYAELFSRYEKRAYCVAMHLTRNHELAQDAVQEAMLDVWLHAASHRPGHEAGWILRIVTNTSITLAQRRKKEGKQMTEQEAADAGVRNSSPAELTERKEQLEVLRETLARLPLLDRQVLALHYAGGQTQAEIGAALSLSQKAISNRLVKACAQVRTLLSNAGYAAVLPLVSAEGLSAAICSGYESPPGLRERVLESAIETVRSGLRTAVSHSRRVASAKAGGGAWILATAAAVAAAGLGALWFAQPPGQPAPARNVPPAAAAPLPAPAGPGLISRTWDFNSNETPKDLTVVEGEWHPLEKGGPNGSGCMETKGKVRFVLDVPIEQLPVAVSYQIYTKNNNIITGVRWERHAGGAFFLPLGSSLTSQAGTWFSGRYLVTAEAISFYPENFAATGAHPLSVDLIRRQDRTRLSMWLGADEAIRVDNLRLESISPEQAPDIRPFMTALEKIPPSERTGEKLLKGSASPVPGKTVSVRFIPESAEPGTKP